MGVRARRMGVVSDTHGLFDPALATVLKGVELIVHAGDVVGAEVLEALGRIAPVAAIVGNCDGPPLTRELPEWRMVEFGGERILVTHDLGTPERVRAPAAALIERERPTIVVSGHSHAGRLDARGGVLFVNPGSAGRKRFRLLRSCAVIDVRARSTEARLISLEDPVGRVAATCARPRPS